MKHMETYLTFEEIKQMSDTKFKQLVKDSCKTKSLHELKKEKKGEGDKLG